LTNCIKEFFSLCFVARYFKGCSHPVRHSFYLFICYWLCKGDNGFWNMQEKVINNLLFKFQLVIAWVKIPYTHSVF
jgi:hypothetical protein